MTDPDALGAAGVDDAISVTDSGDGVALNGAVTVTGVVNGGVRSEYHEHHHSALQDRLELINGILAFAGTVLATLAVVRNGTGWWFGFSGVLGLAVIAGVWTQGRRNSGLASSGGIFLAFGVICVFLSAYGLLAGQQPADVPTPAVASSRAAPHRSPASVPNAASPSSGEPLSSPGYDNNDYNGNDSALNSHPSRTVSPSPSHTSTRPITSSPATQPTQQVTDATIEITYPRLGDSLSTTANINGFAKLPSGYQIWLLWRHGNAGPYRVEEACHPARAFSCDPVHFTRDGGIDFYLYAIVVDPLIATLAPGQDLSVLPPAAAKYEVLVHRQSE